MQRRIRPALLTDNAYGSNYRSPSEKVLDVTYLNGGLNLWELDYRLDANQSPDLINVCWKDGSLSSRQGQEYLFNAATASAEQQYGNFYACYEKPWQGYMIAHKGRRLYKVNYTTGAHTELNGGVLLTEGYGGSFFVFGDKLYYMNGHEYVQISNALVASYVVGYIPTVIVNRYYDGTGGTTYQDENRIQAGKKIQFTTGNIPGSTETTPPTTYQVPAAYCPMDSTAVICKLTSPQVIEYNEVQTVSSLPSTGVADIYYQVGSTYYKWVNGAWTTVSAPSNTFTVNRTTGVITFATAPPAHLTQTPSNLDVTVFKTNSLAQENIYSCRCVTVYGGDTELAVVVGGPTSTAEDGSKVANAYFWSGSTNVGLDPTYFPFDYYNYAGANSDEAIIAFGKQQKMLIIFKENSIGKSYFEISQITTSDSSGEELFSVSYLNLPYTPLNDSIGCNLEKTVRLVQNNLIFANTYGGVYVLLDTTAAQENSVKRISRNVNGNNVLKTLAVRTYSYATSSAFPEVGEPGVYYKANDTNFYYIWDIDAEDYQLTRLAQPASGLMYDLRQVAATAVTSFDDGQRYWITANGHAYLWDYTLSSISSYERNMCWFYFDNINPRAWFKTIDEGMYGTNTGSLVKFTDVFNDFGSPIPRRYVFATQNFNTYEALKDVLKVIFAVRSDTDTAINITYKTDYETRVDLTPIRSYSWRLAPRDLSHRSLKPINFAGTAIRTPRCFHVRHFQMTLTNDSINTDMSVISAQIVYRFSREDR